MRAPALFVAHGAPTLAIEENDFTGALRNFGSSRPAPPAVVVISAHWLTRAGGVTGASAPPTIHDFGGFADELYQITYACPGAPKLAARIAARLGVPVDAARGLDHGAWVPLRFLFPLANVPVVQVALKRQTPNVHLAMGRELAALRDEGCWIVGSGGIVHNLGQLAPRGAPAPGWATGFDRWVADRVASLDLSHLVEYRKEAPGAALSAPTDEHLLPIFVPLGAALPGDQISTLYEGFDHGSLSMRSFVLSDTAPQLSG